jgi:hypothetical protein
VVAAHARHVTAVKATAYVTATKAAHVAAAESAAAESATTVSSSAAATAGLRTRGKKAAGKHCACQNHHHSSSHDILLCDDGLSATSRCQMPASQESKRRRRDGLEMGMLICGLH